MDCITFKAAILLCFGGGVGGLILASLVLYIIKIFVKRREEKAFRELEVAYAEKVAKIALREIASHVNKKMTFFIEQPDSKRNDFH